MSHPYPPLTVLYEDACVLVADKPAGMLVHRGWANDDVTLVDQVRARYGGGCVHPIGRLDRGCSGAMLFARDRDSARCLASAGDTPGVVKHYVALVRGEAPVDGVIAQPLPTRPGGARVAARSSFRRLATVAAEPRSVSLVEVIPETGRLHQVRRHLKHINHPLLGDANYGKGPLNRAVASRYGLGRLALHAHTLRFVHPRTATLSTVVAPLPPDFAGPLSRMGFALRDLSPRMESR